MNASPFQKRIMITLSIVCMVTLIFPTLYYIKYVAFDFPREEKIAQHNGILSAGPHNEAYTPADPNFDSVRWYMDNATSSPDPLWRAWGCLHLRQLCQKPGAQVFHWMECLNAKTTLLRVAQTDPDPQVVATAKQALGAVGEHGVMFRR